MNINSNQSELVARHIIMYPLKETEMSSTFLVQFSYIFFLNKYTLKLQVLNKVYRPMLRSRHS